MSIIPKPLTDEEIYGMLIEYYQDIDLAKTLYEDLLRTIRQKIIDLQSVCPHNHKRYNMGSSYDPSYYTCEVCGKEL
jgi:hypothetical protein